jgi:hypothetical protein
MGRNQERIEGSIPAVTALINPTTYLTHLLVILQRYRAAVYSKKWGILPNTIFYTPYYIINFGRSVSSTYSHKRLQKFIERKIVLIFSATFVYTVCLCKINPRQRQKVKVTHQQATKAQRGSRGTAVFIP